MFWLKAQLFGSAEQVCGAGLTGAVAAVFRGGQGRALMVTAQPRKLLFWMPRKGNIFCSPNSIPSRHGSLLFLSCFPLKTAQGHHHA